MTRIIVTGTTAKTPHIAALERGDGYFQKKYYDITLSKEGYVTEKVSIAPELNPWYIANLFFGGVLGMVIIDPLTGSMWTFYEKDVSVKLYPDTPEGRAARTADEQARAVAKTKEEAEREKQSQPRRKSQGS